ncbi:MAG TPA: APC family permease [Longimicrobiales bacterium]
MKSRERGLLQVLGVAFGLAVLVGNTIGMGILRTPGEIATHLPSVPLFMAVWIVGALYALLGALSLAELGAQYPQSGGLYPYVRRGLGPAAGFTTGWTDWVATTGSVSAVAIVLGEYAGPLIPPLDGHQKLTAAGVIIFFTLLQWRGIRIGDAAQRITSLLKAVALIALAVAALILGADAATTAATAATATAPGTAAHAANKAAEAIPTGVAFIGALVLALQSAIYTYDGWTGPLYFAEEVKDPARDIPRSMIGGVLLVLAIYLALNIAFLRVVPIGEMAGDPFVAATAAARIFGSNGATAVRVLMIISLVATVNALMLMASRVPYAMSRDGMMPAVFDSVNSGGTPVPSLVGVTLLSLLLIATNSFDSLLAILAFFFVANYVLAFTAVFALRRREPDAKRPFRIPGFPWTTGVALAGSVAFLVAAAMSDRANSLRALLMFALSVPFYLIARRRATRTRQSPPST